MAILFYFLVLSQNRSAWDSCNEPAALQESSLGNWAVPWKVTGDPWRSTYNASFESMCGPDLQSEFPLRGNLYTGEDRLSLLKSEPVRTLLVCRIHQKVSSI